MIFDGCSRASSQLSEQSNQYTSSVANFPSQGDVAGSVRKAYSWVVLDAVQGC